MVDYGITRTTTYQLSGVIVIVNYLDHTSNDVLSINDDIFVSVWSRLLVIKAKRMTLKKEEEDEEKEKRQVFIEQAVDEPIGSQH